MTIRADHLTVHFPSGLLRRRFAALEDVTLHVREGDFYALLGSNGAGKTTAMQCFLGLLRPTRGTVQVLGGTPRPGAPCFRHIGYLPEEPRYHEYLTIDEALVYYARLSGLAAPRPRLDLLLDAFGLTEHRARKVRQCSKGMKQKLGIIQAIAAEPRLLLLDEPLRGLDPAAVHVFRDLLLDMHRRGVTIVMSSHLLGEVEMVANRVAILERGRLVVEDDLAALVSTDAARYAVEFEGGEAALPGFLQDSVRTDGRVQAHLPAEDFYAFIEFTRANGLRVTSCAMEKHTLEDRFLAIVAERGTHA